MRRSAAGLLGIVLCAAGAFAADPVALRMENFTVTPSTGPLVFVEVKNLQKQPYRGTISVSPPGGWRIAPARREIALSPGEVQRVAFAIEKGRNMPGNSYPIKVTAVGAGVTVTRRQNVVVASAPYFKPTIDGEVSDWKEAIPVKFETAGKKTIISTYWNRRGFSILVAVEEDELVARADAVQFALSPADAKTGTSTDDEGMRFEFLLTTGSQGKASCFQLATPGMKLAEVARARSLGPLKYEDAQIAVSRRDGVTFYECSLPFGPMRKLIRPSEGREFCLSVLVHDPDGTGLRDWGRAAGLWPCRRNRLAWSRWAGAKWPDDPPFDNKIEWGLCSSQY